MITGNIFIFFILKGEIESKIKKSKKKRKRLTLERFGRLKNDETERLLWRSLHIL